MRQRLRKVNTGYREAAAPRRVSVPIKTGYPVRDSGRRIFRRAWARIVLQSLIGKEHASLCRGAHSSSGIAPFRMNRLGGGTSRMELGADLFATLIDNLNDGVYFVDRKRRIHYWSRGAERLTGYNRKEVAGRCCADNILVHVDEHGRALCTGMCPLSHTMEDGQARECALIYFKHKEGHRVPVKVYAAPIRNEQGEIIGAVESFHTAETLPSVLDEIQTLKRELYYCPLTGVANRRYAEDCLPQKYEDVLQGRGKAGVLLIDVDHFKSYNDKYGHHVGDLVLKMVARTLANALRSFDIIARWGGEEFIVLMPAMIESDVESTANRLRVLVERSSREISQERITATVSIGGVFVREHRDFAEAVQEADRLMYVCKRNGRNQARVETLLRRVDEAPPDE